jgi:hypothetical protein
VICSGVALHSNTGTNLEGVTKLNLAIEKVGFVARQFALWVIPSSWWEAEKEPDFTEESIQVSL